MASGARAAAVASLAVCVVAAAAGVVVSGWVGWSSFTGSVSWFFTRRSRSWCRCCCRCRCCCCCCCCCCCVVEAVDRGRGVEGDVLAVGELHSRLLGVIKLLLPRGCGRQVLLLLLLLLLLQWLPLWELLRQLRGK